MSHKLKSIKDLSFLVEIIIGQSSNKFHKIKDPPLNHSLQLDFVPVAKALELGLDPCPICFEVEDDSSS